MDTEYPREKFFCPKCLTQKRVGTDTISDCLVGHGIVGDFDEHND